MRGIGRADDFAGWSTGLRDSGDVGFALLGGEFGEVGDVAVPLAGAHPKAGAGDIEIGLDEDSGGRGGGAGRVEEDAGCGGESEDDTGYSAEALTRRAIEHEARGDERVDGYEQEADAVDAGPGSELIDEQVVYLRVAELIPGHGGDAGGSEFQAGPENGRGGQREGGAAGGLSQERDGAAEEADVEAKDQAVSNEQQRGCKRGHVEIGRASCRERV